jgi:predicted membrane metal-binding protein
MLILVRITFFLGLVISLICFYLYMTGLEVSITKCLEEEPF